MPNETMMRVFHIDDGDRVATYSIRDSHINIGYGECTTVAAAQAKEVALLGEIGWGLREGSFVIVKFTYAVPAGATLNVTSTGAKPIYHKNSGIKTDVIRAGDIVTFVFDGTNYVVVSIDRIMSGIFEEMTARDVTNALGYTPLNAALKGSVNGLAELNSSGKVSSSQLPAYVDDVVEYANSTAFPAAGESGKIYVALDTNLTYRWSGTAYVEISASLALGETSSTAYRGDHGASAYAHAVTNKGSAFASGLYKIETNAEGHVTGAVAVQKSDLMDIGAVSQPDEGTEATAKLPQTPMLMGANEPFYPITHASQVIKTDGSRLEKDGRINADTASTADRLGGKAPEYYIQPHNLLDNSDFRNPVNQRNIWGERLPAGYIMDRWRTWEDGATITPNPGKCVDVQGASLTQYIPEPWDRGIVTLAVKIYGVDTPYVCMLDTSKVGSAGSDVAYIERAETYLGVQLYEGHAYEWAALYEGAYTADTLPPYIPKGYAHELLECQRYYYPIPNAAQISHHGYIYNATTARITIQLPTLMRVNTPTLVINNLANLGIWSAQDSQNSISAVDAGRTAGTCLYLNVTGSFSPPGVACVMRFNTSAALSADL